MRNRLLFTLILITTIGHSEVSKVINDASKYYQVVGLVKILTTMTCSYPKEKAGKIIVNDCEWGERIHFDKQGRELEYFGLEDKQHVTMTAKSYYNEEGFYRGFKVYNENGELTESSVVSLSPEKFIQNSRVYDASNTLEYTMKFENDDRGNRISTQRFDSEGMLQNQIKNTYNSKNRKITEQYYNENGVMIEEKMFIYNDAGQIVSTSVFNKTRNKTKIFNYQYSVDTYGNWTQKREYTKGKLKAIWQREIEYY